MLSLPSAENAQHAQSPKQCRANMSCIQGTVQQCLSSRIRCFHGPTILPDRSIRRSTAQIILEMQTCEKCLQRRISPLEYALTENRACNSFRIRTYNFIGLKASWNEHLQKTPGGRGEKEAKEVEENGRSRGCQVFGPANSSPARLTIPAAAVRLPSSDFSIRSDTMGRTRASYLAFVFTFLLALAAAPWLLPPDFAQDSSPIAGPPVAPVRPVVDEYFGTKVEDPYRYMEDLKNPEVAAWMKAQNDFTRAALARILGRAELLARIKQLDESAPARVGGVKRLPSGRHFYLKALGKEPVFKLYMREGTSGTETLLVDPEKMSAPGGPPYALNYYAPSDDGRYVAYGVSPGGSENAVLHILDTTTVHDTGETIDRAQFGEPIGWRPDGRSFFYNRLQKLAPDAPPTEKYLKSRTYLHIVGTDPEKDSAVFGFGVSPAVKVEPPDFSVVATAPESSSAFGLVAHGVQNEVTLYVAPLDSVGKP